MDSWEGCNAELWLTVLKCPRPLCNANALEHEAKPAKPCQVQLSLQQGLRARVRAAGSSKHICVRGREDTGKKYYTILRRRSESLEMQIWCICASE